MYLYRYRTRIVLTMAIYKGETEKRNTNHARHRPFLRWLCLSLPAVCLLAYAFHLPLPLPRLLVPSSLYDAGAGSIDTILKDAATRLALVRIRLERSPSGTEVQAAQKHYKDTGMPVSFITSTRTSGPLAAYAMHVAPESGGSTLTVLLDEAASGLPIAASLDGTPVMTASKPSTDRRISLSLPGREAGAPSGASTMELSLTSGSGGTARVSRLVLVKNDPLEPRILMISEKTDARSLIEAIRPLRKIGYRDLSLANIYDYELVVLDAPVFIEIEGATATLLADYVTRGAGSLMVIVDSPSIGKPGDAPALERILPVDLSPRSLSRLPDAAMAVALDVSGSMYGDKLSLAKAVGLELVANLKPSDEAGILLFDDEARWLYPPAPVANLDAKKTLSPLRAGGGTRLYPAVLECLTALEASSQAEKRLVIVSDGITAPADFDGLAARAFSSGITISAMALGEEYDRALLTRLSLGSGGRFYRVKNAREVPSLIIEDRKSASRTVFSEEPVGIVDIAGVVAGKLGGMARLGPKADALAFYSSEAGDPLLITRRLGSRSVLVYASDVYGRYGKEFLETPAVLSVFQAVIGGLFLERPPSLMITETADGLSLSIQGDYLVSPSLLLADASARVVAELDFDKLSPGRFYAEPGRQQKGRYTALIEDRGVIVTRFPFYVNAQASASPSDSAAAADAYRTPFWVLLKNTHAWLIAFFVCSLGATLLLRLRP